MGNIPELASSIIRLGLLQPIVVSEEMDLIAGARRLAAFRILSEDDARYREIPARIVKIGGPDRLHAEHDENEVRKAFVPSERVAIMKAIEDQLRAAKNCNGGKVKEAAAEAAGFGNRETARQAEAIVTRGAPELVAAVDDGTVSISDAAAVVDKPQEVQVKAIEAVKSGASPTVKAAAIDKSEVKGEAYRSISTLIRACDSLQVVSSSIVAGDVRSALGQIKAIVGSAR